MEFDAIGSKNQMDDKVLENYVTNQDFKRVL